MKRIFVLAPHTDDGELGCGGSIARYRDEGMEVNYLAFSHTGNGELVQEAHNAAEFLGVNIMIRDYPVRHFPEHRQAILDDMIAVRDVTEPDLVFTPAMQDIHQDHQVITAEAMRAFKHTSIFGYELPWNNFTIDTTAFITLREADVEKKIQAIECYKSQSHRPYVKPDVIRGLAKIRGLQTGAEYAEAFTVIRWVL